MDTIQKIILNHSMNDAVSVCDLSESEVPFILNYWFHSPPGFVEAMGVDIAKLPKEAEMKTSLEEKIRANLQLANSKLNALIIKHQGEAVGFHTLVPITEGESGIFHAHIWNSNYRCKGIALKSYPLACGVLMKRFNLQRILFKTPTQNVGALRVKEKLGIRCIGEELIDFGIIKANTQAKVFELTQEELEKLI